VADGTKYGFENLGHEFKFILGSREVGSVLNRKMVRRHLLVVFAAIFSLSGAAFVGPRVATDTLPTQLSDRAFWKLVTEFSEQDGDFRADNFVSNETTLQEVIPELEKRVSSNGVYIGVGPDQNFTYITALRPRMAFIIDIRRQNLIEHLMFKAIIEMSADRADFLSRLFSRRRPVGLDRTTPVNQLFDAYSRVAPTENLYVSNLQDVVERLTTRHGFALSDEDRRTIDYVYHAFCTAGPELRYSYPRQRIGARWFPTYSELLMTTDLAGQNRSYMASDENFRVLREFERKNLLVPIVGDFAGDKAIQAVARYLRDHGGTANFFYTSNVEQYLFQDDAWQRYYRNVATLPTDGNSTFIRAYFNRGFRYPPGIITPDLHSVELLDPIPSLLSVFRSGGLQSYDDVVARTKF
jgi:hypothetical protein